MKGKRRRKDVEKFGLHLTDHVMALHNDLIQKIYRHGSYHAFKVRDPKPRDIHKASVRDRLAHHAMYRILYPLFDRKFIFDSYSCRKNKGTHRAINRFKDFARIVSQNHTRTAWVLKCDIRKFFASIDHEVLFRILGKHIADEDVMWLLTQVVTSFHSNRGKGKGLPLGNLTSQLLVNVYMNEFDQFVKRKLKALYYIRYADDFVVLHHDPEYLEQILEEIHGYLKDHLALDLHPKKVSISTISSGVDYLGWVHFPHHRVLRTTTKRRMLNRLAETENDASLQSYLGLLRHGDTYKLRRIIEKQYEAGKDKTTR